jgi:hypothetical protein
MDLQVSPETLRSLVPVLRDPPDPRDSLVVLVRRDVMGYLDFRELRVILVFLACPVVPDRRGAKVIWGTRGSPGSLADVDPQETEAQLVPRELTVRREHLDPVDPLEDPEVLVSRGPRDQRVTLRLRKQFPEQEVVRESRVRMVYLVSLEPQAGMVYQVYLGFPAPQDPLDQRETMDFPEGMARLGVREFPVFQEQRVIRDLVDPVKREILDFLGSPDLRALPAPRDFLVNQGRCRLMYLRGRGGTQGTRVPPV